jgi:DNA replication protein DnaC
MSESEQWDPADVVARMRDLAEQSGAEERVAELEAKEKAAEERRVDDVLTAWGVPLRYRDDLRRLRETPAIAHARRFLALDRRDKWALVLGGDKGQGKSVAAAWWLSQVARDVKLSPAAFRRWWSVNDLQRLGNWAPELEQLWSVQTLVIDDLGAEFSDAKGNWASMLYGLVEKRSANYLRTLITTNLGGPDMRARYDERIVDRLASGALFAGVTGKSMRRAG